MSSRIGRRFLGTLVLAAASVASCGDEPKPPAPEPPGADGYAVVVGRFIPPVLDPEHLPVVYVVPVRGDRLDLETQVAVIETLAAVADVQFLDDPAAAVDQGSEDQPPRNDATLIGLGRFSATPPYTVRVETYRGRDRIDGRLLTVTQQGGVWAVVASETVAPEGLVGDG